ncbi:MAG: bifunctional salicylyl-CoA 5-hydroxylase/oxidoreductase [Planctomycetes bacterium]|nr:bifunctional salicylyl-CoA 5-hydroxylase/oxidoreductase [Planctomycetota bacterium]MCB9935827.1 bifunctional salicylyl-CoA 5-hydroxylase/oxidoreductase [Planctomycetota bacterium]
MKIVSIGGGPAGLYFSILMKKQDPAHDITVIERNRPYDTFGWGVVFSDETLGGFEVADKPSYDRIVGEFAYWPDIDTHIKGEVIRSTGHGFAGMSRKKLLNIFQARAEELGVKLVFEKEVHSLEPFNDADLILGADGVNSWVRDHHKQFFQPDIDWRKCKFCWLGADFKLPAFTFIYEENEHGLFTVHAYPFEENTSTWIVECREETWRKAGLDKADEAQTIAYCEKLFAKYLSGHKLLGNKSVWRTFPTIRNKTWVHENIVLMGDAAHTAHFSIGSGTKLAMEDAIELAQAFKDNGCENVNATLKLYEARRWVDGAKLQKTAQTSLEWFENVARYYHTQHPVRFTFNQLSRSKRITYDNLKMRDPAFVETATDWFAKQNQFRDVRVKAPAYAAESDEQTIREHFERAEQPTAPPVFQPFQLRDMTLANRLVVSPMCQYSSDDGFPGDWHMVHLGSRAIGGAGLLYTEATHVSPIGRITPGCAGMYKPEHVAAWKRVVDFTHGYSKAKICMQLAHAGRKASTDLPWKGGKPLTREQGAWQTLAPSALPYKDDWPTPSEMTPGNMDAVKAQFVQSAKWADEAGFDMIELHYAHGYLMSTFISPLTNKRTDGYGGSLEARMRYPLECFKAVRAAWPEGKPISVRISATEWHEDGLTDADRVEIARMFKDAGLDIIDVSAGQVVHDQQPVYGRMFQTPFSDLIRNEAHIATMTVGNVQTVDQANTILLAGRADLVVMARPHLFDPYMMIHAAADYDYDLQYWPPQYLAAKPRPKA